MRFFKNILLLFIVLFLSHFTAIYFGRLYEMFISLGSGFFNYGGLVLQYSAGINLAYTFFLVILFVLLGGEKKYWWIGILLIPAIFFELFFDLGHIYFPIIIGLVSWVIGLGILKLKATLKQKSST